MARLIVLIAILAFGADAALAQKDQKSVQEQTIAQSPFLKPPPRVSANRTIEVLRTAGLLNVRTDSPFTLSPRQPYLDSQTYLTVERGSLYPERNIIVLNDRSAVTIHWFGNPDRRYVVDCAFAAGTGPVRFDWSGGVIPITPDRLYDETPIIGGRAAIVLPRGASASARITQQGEVELSTCDVTPFGE